MRPNRWQPFVALAAGVMTVAAACSSAASTPAATVLGATATPVVTAAPVATTAPSAMASTAMTVAIGSAQSSSLGAYLTGPNGLTLYVFANDTSGKSSCTAACAANWPALTAASGATITGPSGATGTFSLITRDDGSMQVAYNGMPLYYFKGDSAPGQTNGQGILGKWFVAPVSGQLPGAAPSAATKTSGSSYGGSY